jgi:hypothetical protein
LNSTSPEGGRNRIASAPMLGLSLVEGNSQGSAAWSGAS